MRPSGATTPKTPATDGEFHADDRGSAPKKQRIEIGSPPTGNADNDKVFTRRVKDAEITVPIVHGTIAFYLGRKATESQSHKWTVYVRGPANEDLGAVVKCVVFQLHPSFNNPIRAVESPPFELSECGWGEFEIAITLYFHSDVCDKQLDLLHHLRLYPEDETGPQSTKKPVIVEHYNEIVFPDPSENFLARVYNHPAVLVPRLPSGFNLPIPVPIENVTGKGRGDTKDHPLSQWFIHFSEADELLKLAAARQQAHRIYTKNVKWSCGADHCHGPLCCIFVQAYIVKLRRQLSATDGLPQLTKPASIYDL